MGPPGAGKGTQADKICAKYNIPHISTGDIFRANIKNNTELGQKAKSYMDKGELVPDELVVDLVVDRIKADDCTNGYVLDGFPRTIPQAEALDAALAAINDKVDYAINVEVPDENIINRMSGRRECVACGATYHIVHIPTKVEGVCDKCGAEFRNPRECRVHEAGHFHGIDKIKYDLINNQEEDICDYCEKSYYVYGCEQDCEYKDCKYSNNYKKEISK